VNDHELLRLIDFLAETRAPLPRLMPVADESPIWNITLQLVTHEIRGQPLTISSLSQASGVPHATAMRLIARMTEQGHIVRRPVGPNGKRFTLHPAKHLMSGFRDYAGGVKSLLARVIGVRESGEVEADFYFGGAPVLPANPRRSVPLRFLVSDDNYFQALRGAWSDLRVNLASTRDFDLRPLPDLRAEIVANAARAESNYDIVALNAPWLAELASQGQLLPLEEVSEAFEANLRQVHPVLLKRGRWDGRRYAVPIYATSYLAAVRRDLREEQGVRAPRTPDDLLRLARRLHRPADDQYGIVWDAARGMPLASSFMIFLGAFAGPPDAGRDEAEQLMTRLRSPAAQETLSYMHHLLEFSPPGQLERAWDANLDLFNSGRAAIAYGWSMRAVRMEHDVKSVVKRRVEYHAPPVARGRPVGPLGGFYLAVPANLPPGRREHAVALLERLTEDIGISSGLQSGYPLAPRFLAAAEPGTRAGSPILKRVEKLAHDHALVGWHRPQLPGYTMFEHVVGDAVYTALTGGARHRDTLDLISNALELAKRAPSSP
jgi:multiple sugar transport system substrate-binding protein